MSGMDAETPPSAPRKPQASPKPVKSKRSRLYRGGLVPRMNVEGRFTREELERAVDAAFAKYAETLARGG